MLYDLDLFIIFVEESLLSLMQFANCFTTQQPGTLSKQIYDLDSHFSRMSIVKITMKIEEKNGWKITGKEYYTWGCLYFWMNGQAELLKNKTIVQFYFIFSFWQVHSLYIVYIWLQKNFLTVAHGRKDRTSQESHRLNIQRAVLAFSRFYLPRCTVKWNFYNTILCLISVKKQKITTYIKNWAMGASSLGYHSKISIWLTFSLC